MYNTAKGVSMLTGIIDVGSNTLRLAIFKHEPQGGFTPLVSRKIVVGLVGYKKKGALSAKGQAKLCKCLEEFLCVTRALEVTDVQAFATASLRYTSNASEVVSAVLAKTGLNLKLLSGEEEARLSFLGARYSMRLEDGLVVDIGGASCEIILVANGAIEELCSIPVGCLSESLRANSSIFFDGHEIKKMKSNIKQQVLTARHLLKDPTPTVCFVGGTARAVYRVASEIKPRFDRQIQAAELSHIIAGLSMRDAEVVEAVRFAAPERIFTLLAGALIMQSVVKQSKATTLLVSRCGVREGYLLNNVINGTLE
jgi:exopolyphosphatase/guanosine-5'-triphosphate,3'-diphosphate pyrophosphatase